MTDDAPMPGALYLPFFHLNRSSLVLLDGSSNVSAKR
jgi:hypothetical protein